MIYEREVIGVLLRYNAFTGQIWRRFRGGWGRAGKQLPRWKKVAICEDAQGYLRTKLAGKSYKAHRVAWFIVHGVWPTDELDHGKHKRNDNRLSELAQTSHKDNSRNRSKNHNNTSGVTGVIWDSASQKWMAQIEIHGKNKNLGRFTAFDLAVEARLAAEIYHGFHPNHGA